MENDYRCIKNEYKELSKNYKKDIKKMEDLNEARLKSLQDIIINKTEECKSINAQLKNYKEKYNKDFLEWKQAKLKLENEIKKNKYNVTFDFDNKYAEKLDALQKELKKKNEELNKKEEKILYFNKKLTSNEKNEKNYEMDLTKVKAELDKTKYELQKKSNNLEKYVDISNKQKQEIKSLKDKIDFQNVITSSIQNDKEKIMEQVFHTREAKLEMTKQCVQYQEDILKKEEIIQLLNDNLEKLQITNKELLENNKKFKTKEYNELIEKNKQKKDMNVLMEDIKNKQKDIDKLTKFKIEYTKQEKLLQKYKNELTKLRNENVKLEELKNQELEKFEKEKKNIKLLRNNDIKEIKRKFSIKLQKLEQENRETKENEKKLLEKTKNLDKLLLNISKEVI